MKMLRKCNFTFFMMSNYNMNFISFNFSWNTNKGRGEVWTPFVEKLCYIYIRQILHLKHIYLKLDTLNKYYVFGMVIWVSIWIKEFQVHQQGLWGIGKEYKDCGGVISTHLSLIKRYWVWVPLGTECRSRSNIWMF